VKKGAQLKIFVYQKAVEPVQSPVPNQVAEAEKTSDEVIVPNLSGYREIAQMQAAASAAGLVPVLAASRESQPEGSASLYAGQDPKPGTKEKRGRPLTIFIYQKAVETAASSPPPPPPLLSASPPPSTALTGTMPNLIGLTLQQAVSRLPSNMRIGSDEVGDPPPSSERAFTIFSQRPAAGEAVSDSRSISISVKRYGSARTTTKPREANTPKPVEVSKKKKAWPKDHFRPIGEGDPGTIEDLSEWRRRNQPHR
jgi:hypothetical protein